MADAIWNTKFGILCTKIYVLDDDINPTDPSDFMWAVPTRCNPKGHKYETTGPILPLLTCCTQEERKARTATRVAHDCLFPEGARPRHSSFAGAYPEEVRQRVLDNWNK
jgi:4-hydroxy-3-polyprenylbenzoate decarboxylase